MLNLNSILCRSLSVLTPGKYQTFTAKSCVLVWSSRSRAVRRRMCCEYNALHEFLTPISGKYKASGRDITVAPMTFQAVVERYGDDVTSFDARGMER